MHDLLKMDHLAYNLCISHSSIFNYPKRNTESETYPQSEPTDLVMSTL